MLRFAWVLLAALSVVGAGAPELEVDRIFAPYAAPNRPGCAVGVSLAGKTVLAKGYGSADLETGRPITATSRFYMASVSKQFTAMSVLLAARDGRWKLDDPINRYLPEIPAAAGGEAPIRRLLDHTAGLRDFLTLWTLRGFTNESVLKEAPSVSMVARQQGLEFPIGSAYSYSNSGYLLAAVALRRVTGRDLAEFAQERIFRPLGMNATRFQADHAVPIPERAHGYRLGEGGWRTVDVGFDVIGSGGMYSTVLDTLLWARNFEKPVIGGEEFAALQTPGKLTDGRPTPGGYALGMVARDGVYSHSGGATGYSTFLLRIPAKQLAVVCLCNHGGVPAGELAERVAGIYTGTVVPAKKSQPGTPRLDSRPWRTGELTALGGVYWSEELGGTWTLRVHSGGMRAETEGDERNFEPEGEWTYRSGDARVEAVRDAAGLVTGLTVGLGRAHGIRFTRR